MEEKQIDKLLQSFLKEWTADGTYRYASFDYCFSYFNSFDDKRKIASDVNLEKSCLHLGFYLASWGMLRGSSFLLQKSLRFYVDVVRTISETPRQLWDIDANNYSKGNINALIETYNAISNHYKGKRDLTLTTKIMLGVFGNTPAFDDFFCTTFRTIYKGNGFRKFNVKSLNLLSDFYHQNKAIIDRYHNDLHCKNFVDGLESDLKYKRAKIIDMIGFQGSFKPR